MMKFVLFCLWNAAIIKVIEQKRGRFISVEKISVGVQSPTEINAPRGCAVILRRICQLSLTRITHQVSRAFDLNDLTRT